ncbi:hypothetical protein HDU86_001494 [Geranomyces michiganensis]|nr:hypothetical protein HDU86_001494 [Geranomyces michiganensis]
MVGCNGTGPVIAKKSASARNAAAEIESNVSSADASEEESDPAGASHLSGKTGSQASLSAKAGESEDESASGEFGITGIGLN